MLVPPPSLLLASCRKHSRQIKGEAKRPSAQIAYALDFFWQHPGETALSFAREAGRQLLHPMRLSPHLHRYRAYAWATPGPGVLVVFWIASGAGLGILLRRDPALGMFWLAVGALILGPAATSHLVMDRLRLPLDLLAIPCAALALDRGLSWASRLGRLSPSAES